MAIFYHPFPAGRGQLAPCGKNQSRVFMTVFDSEFHNNMEVCGILSGMKGIVIQARWQDLVDFCLSLTPSSSRHLACIQYSTVRESERVDASPSHPTHIACAKLSSYSNWSRCYVELHLSTKSQCD
jgi:hypothetical protein